MLGPNEYRAASGPVGVTCTAIGGTGTINYQWSSTCRNCPFKSSKSSYIRRGAVHSGDTGIHTCMATTADSENLENASITFSVIGEYIYSCKIKRLVYYFLYVYCTFPGAGIHVFNGVPIGYLPNNGLVSLHPNHMIFRLHLFCRSDSMMENVGIFIGLDGSRIVTHNSSFFEVSNPQPGELSVVNFVANSTALNASGQGVYTCRIPLQSGQIRELNIGIYPSGFTGKFYFLIIVNKITTSCILHFPSFCSTM